MLLSCCFYFFTWDDLNLLRIRLLKKNGFDSYDFFWHFNDCSKCSGSVYVYVYVGMYLCYMDGIFFIQ